MTPAAPLERCWQLSRRAVPGALLGLAGVARAQLPAGDDPQASPRWQAVRRSLYGDQPFIDATPEQLAFTAPRRAEDPAFAPLSVRCPVLDGPNAVRRLTLIIDNNPSPVAAIIDLPSDGAWPEVETRVRVDEYSFVRAVAETADARLLMATRFVKASGGCSAPAGADEAAAAAALGRMSWRADAEPAEGRPLTVQWMISHPNHSGMAMNPLTRQFTPAHYVRQVRLFQGERLLLAADVDFALSENPTLRFRFVPRGREDLRAEAVDTHNRRYGGAVALKDLR